MELRQRIRGLDGLRAIAVIFVFLDHKVLFFNRLEIGSAGVTLFFVLSGYLITSILLRRRGEIDQGAATCRAEILHFFKNRSFRIFPAYFAMILIVTALTKLGLHLVTYADVPCYMTFTTNFCVKAWQTWPPLGHFWSLAIEEQFYILSAPLFLLTPVRKARTVVVGLLAVAVFTFCVETAAGATSITIGVDSLINFGMLAIGSAIAIAARTADGTASRWLVVGLGLLVFTKDRAVAVRYVGVDDEHGELFLAVDPDGTPVGCVGLRAFEPGRRCELKRFFVREGVRGAGLGRRLLDAALAFARQAGYTEVVLDALPALTRAIALYERFGFERIPRYWDNQLPGIIYFSKQLSPSAAAAESAGQGVG